MCRRKLSSIRLENRVLLYDTSMRDRIEYRSDSIAVRTCTPVRVTIRGIETAKEEKKRRTILSARRPICSDRSALGYNGHLPVQPRSFILFLFLSCLFFFVSLLMTAITLSTSLCLSSHPKKIYGRELPRLQEIEEFKTLGGFVSDRETRLNRK